MRPESGVWAANGQRADLSVPAILSQTRASEIVTPDDMSEPGTIAANLTCAECGRPPRLADEVAREAMTYCPDCAEREFGGEDRQLTGDT